MLMARPTTKYVTVVGSVGPQSVVGRRERGRIDDGGTDGQRICNGEVWRRGCEWAVMEREDFATDSLCLSNEIEYLLVGSIIRNEYGKFINERKGHLKSG